MKNDLIRWLGGCTMGRLKSEQNLTRYWYEAYCDKSYTCVNLQARINELEAKLAPPPAAEPKAPRQVTHHLRAVIARYIYALGWMTVKDLEAHTGNNTGAVATTLQRMIGAGYVKRIGDNYDLTAEGKEYGHKAYTNPAKVVFRRKKDKSKTPAAPAQEVTR